MRIHNELIQTLNDEKENKIQQKLTGIDTMFSDAVRIGFNFQDQYDCFICRKHF